MARKHALLSLAILASAAVLSACGTQLPDARPAFDYSGLVVGDEAVSTYDQAKADFIATRYGLAVKRFQIAMAEDPTSIAAINGLAATYDQIGRFDLAQRLYRRALAMDPNSVQTLNNFGYSLLLQGKYDLAVALLHDAALQDPANNVVVANAKIALTALHADDGHRPAAIPTTTAAQSTVLQAPAAVRTARIIPVNADVQRLQFSAPASPERDERAPPQIKAQPATVVEVMSLPAPAAPQDSAAATSPAAVLPGVRVAMQNTGSEVTIAAGPPERQAAGIDLSGSIELTNGTGRRHMAARLSSYLDGFGLRIARLTNADHFTHRNTTITYRPGHRGLAEALSASLPIAPRMQQVAEQTADVRVQVGGDLLEFDRRLLQAERNNSHADAI